MKKKREALQVKAFQLGDCAILTVDCGAERITSGIFPSRLASRKLAIVDFGKHGKLRVRINTFCNDPEKVGVNGNQLRATWEGVATCTQ